MRWSCCRAATWSWSPHKSLRLRFGACPRCISRFPSRKAIPASPFASTSLFPQDSPMTARPTETSAVRFAQRSTAATTKTRSICPRRGCKSEPSTNRPAATSSCPRLGRSSEPFVGTVHRCLRHFASFAGWTTRCRQAHLHSATRPGSGLGKHPRQNRKGGTRGNGAISIDQDLWWRSTRARGDL
jgi:hypothetical protein